MNRLAPEERWQRFAAAARQGVATLPPEPPASHAPAGLVARVVALALQARAQFVALLWERWSWRVALVTALAALAAGWLVISRAHQPRLDVPVGKLDVPGLESP